MENANEPAYREEAKLSTDAVVDLLAAEPRRRVIAALADTDDGRASVQDLLDAVAPACERRFAVALHHNHLPKLEAHDVVERDGDSVHYLGSPRLEAHLDLVPGPGRQ